MNIVMIQFFSEIQVHKIKQHLTGLSRLPHRKTKGGQLWLVNMTSVDATQLNHTTKSVFAYLVHFLVSHFCASVCSLLRQFHKVSMTRIHMLSISWTPHMERMQRWERIHKTNTALAFCNTSTCQSLAQYIVSTPNGLRTDQSECYEPEQPITCQEWITWPCSLGIEEHHQMYNTKYSICSSHFVSVTRDKWWQK